MAEQLQVENVDSTSDPRRFGLVKAAYSVNETLDLLSIGRTTFYALVRSGDLKIAKLGKKTLIYATDLAALLGKLRDASEQPVLGPQAGKHKTFGSM
jgi:excisionase family DNA binding protein